MKQSAPLQDLRVNAIKSIILADDCIEDCQDFQKALVEIAPDMHLVMVHNGDDLLHLLQHYIPDLLFLDLNMPLKSGVQCLKSIRENRSADILPIIVYSATSRPNNIQVAYGLGANLFFVKLKQHKDLVASLDSLLHLNWNDYKSITQDYFTNNHYRPFSGPL